jgi:signal recognition particle GTPase
MRITSHVIIKANRNYFENGAANEEISEWIETELAESDVAKNAAKDFSETLMKVVDDRVS